MQEERKNSRYMEQVTGMQAALTDDNLAVKDSMRIMDKLSERAKVNFDIIEKENKEEQSAVES